MEACEIIQMLEESGKFLYDLSVGKARNCPEAIKEDIITLAQFKKKHTHFHATKHHKQKQQTNDKVGGTIHSIYCR